jgi:large repetitive protein
LTLVALLGVLTFGVWGAFAVFAASGPSAPSLTQTPSSPTNQSSTTFKYSENQINATFACTVDGTAKTCSGSNSSSTTVGQLGVGPLGDGAHTFSITATVSGKTSSATSFSWTIDTTAPAVALSFPSNGAFANSASWAAGCSAGAGICGSATDANGVASVKVSVLQQSSSKYWNGSSFASASEVYTVATGTTSWRLPLALPAAGSYTVHVTATDTLGNASVSPLAGSFTVDTTAPPPPTITSGPSGSVASSTAMFQFSSNDTGPGTDTFVCKLDSGSYTGCASGVSYSGFSDGSHTFSVEARDAAGNVSATAATRTWSVDTTGPPKPTIVGPNSKSDSTSATFTFSDSESPVTYRCSIDGSAFTACPNPKTYFPVSPGTHEVDVEAVDSLGNIGPFNGWKWTVNGLSGSGQPFAINYTTTPTLWPGSGISRLNLSLTNPNTVTIYITSLTVNPPALSNITHAGPAACTAADFQVTQFSGTYPIALPPGTSTLTQLGATTLQLPGVQMLDLPHSQDRCQGASYTLGFSGQAQS